MRINFLKPTVPIPRADSKTDGYRYEQVAAALVQARLAQPHPEGPGEAEVSQSPRTFATPTPAELALMAALDIHLEAGIFRFAGYQYQRLSDAVSFARLGHTPR